MMTRFLTSASLAAFVGLGSPALAFDIADMTEAERQVFGEEVRAYLMENPQVIIDAVNELERQQQAAQGGIDGALVADNHDAIFDDGFSHVGGNPEGDITLVEFLDYRCGYCRKAHAEVHELIKSDGNIRYITKEFPILGAESLASSQFAIAVRQVAGDEAYVNANNTLIAFNGQVNDTSLRRMAEALGVDADAVMDRMDSPEVAKVISDTRDLARTLKINGTPTFVLEDVMLRGYLPLDSMRQIVDEVRTES